MRAKEIAQSQKLSHLMDIGRRRSLFDGFEFVGPGLHALLGEAEAEVGHVLASEFAFGQIDLHVVLDEPLQDLIKLAEMILV